MFKKLTLLLSLVFTLAFTSSAVAQDIPALDSGDVEGLDSAYGRMYMVDIETVMATPGAAEAVAAGETPLSGMAALFTFDSADNAEAALEGFGDDFTEGFFEGNEAEKNEVDDLGDSAFEYVGNTELDADMMVETTMLFVQDGENIFVSLVIGGEDTSATAQGVVEHMIDGEISDDAVTVVEDGTSTGGAFDVMPTADDADLVGGMVPFMDIDFMEGGSFE